VGGGTKAGRTKSAGGRQDSERGGRGERDGGWETERGRETPLAGGGAWQTWRSERIAGGERDSERERRAESAGADNREREGERGEREGVRRQKVVGRGRQPAR
jgi:hypothetical protein